MGGKEQIRKKLEAYDHQEFNTDEIKDDLGFKMLLGEDYVGRNVDWQGKPFEMWTEEVDLPKYLLDNRNIYAEYFR